MVLLSEEAKLINKVYFGDDVAIAASKSYLDNSDLVFILFASNTIKVIIYNQK